MSKRKNGRLTAKQHNESGLTFYETWEMEKAIAAFQAAATADPDNPEYPLNLARSYARSGDFGEAMNALGNYLHNETKDEIATRYEQLFSSALDGVEQALTDTMSEMEMSLPKIGKALQMWLEYRIVVGRRPLPIPEPKLWAAAITYAIVKINMLGFSQENIAVQYDIQEKEIQGKYMDLVETLDLMPADYRYFLGEENPLDAVVAAGETSKASQLLAKLERRFKKN